MAHLRKQVVVCDGKKLSDHEIEELNRHFKDLTVKQVDFVNALSTREQITHGAMNSYFVHKHFYEHFSHEWYPKERVETTISNLYDKIITDAPAAEAQSVTRSDVTKREMWDPRNDLLDFM